MKLEHACFDVDYAIFVHFRTNGEFGKIRCTPEFDVEAIYGRSVNMRNTENSKIRILLYKQPLNCAHTMTYVSTFSTHKKPTMQVTTQNRNLYKRKKKLSYTCKTSLTSHVTINYKMTLQQNNLSQHNVVHNIKAHVWQMSKRVRSIQSEISISQTWDFLGPFWWS